MTLIFINDYNQIKSRVYMLYKVIQRSYSLSSFNNKFFQIIIFEMLEYYSFECTLLLSIYYKIFGYLKI